MPEAALVLVIAADWATGAILGAQLKEEGCEALVAADFEEAVMLLGRENRCPELLLVESQGLKKDEKALALLKRICGEVPLLLVHGAWDKPSLGWPGAVRELNRPVTIEQIVTEARKLAGGHS